ncbi:MAG: Nre family DNA repair protein [Ignisphaera sp.]|nr:Nre family DNA repair protein [Ignisphaera sp.]MCX8168063.1 Nre family DNA repair protein [Ignisphaera sp.]MDW8085748.1 Nre family DNA repair protein [Ignisphaera sp.]
MGGRLCVLCRGARYLCGRAYCPIVARMYVEVQIAALSNSNHLFGSSPPSVFVGRIGYPYVYAGPLAPPATGDTSVYDYPERWQLMKLEDLLSLRLSLVLGRRTLYVHGVSDRFVESLQHIVLGLKPVDIEMRFSKAPRGYIMSDYEPPIGPRAPIEYVRIVESPATHRAVERLYSDSDARASEAVVELYRAGVEVSHIQKILSVGALGRKRYRKLVPTRWAITAVDDTISRHLIEDRIRWYGELEEVHVFMRYIHRNLFTAILVPGRWSFEWMEAWFPRSTWNPTGETIVIEGDCEVIRPRDEYASIGGCYYASRLATAEYLDRVGRQAIAVVLREIYPGFDIPIGVWFVREQLREMYRQKPLKVSTVEDALGIVARHSSVGITKWVEKSRLLQLLLKTKKLDAFAKRGGHTELNTQT